MRVLPCVTALSLSANLAAAQDIEGHYQVSGTNLDGSAYGGQAEITLTSQFTCEIVWTTNATTSSGICMRSGNAFAAGYELQGKVGLVIYLIEPDGRLTGTWTVAGLNAIGTEVLTPELKGASQTRQAP